MKFIMAAVGDPTAGAGTGGAAASAGGGASATSALVLVTGAMLGSLGTWLARRRVEGSLRRDVRRRDAHLARTSHELRTPLSAVLSALEIVREGHAETDDERALFLEQAELAARHLALLVDDVLDAAAIDAERLRLAPVDLPLDALLSACVGAMRVLAARHHGEVRFPQSPQPHRVRADPRRTSQVLFNLIGNALRFSPPGAPVEVTVHVGGGRARFEVRDRGPGVAEHVRPRLFEAFVGDEGAPNAGTGLGLHVARQLVEQMGGAIGHRPERPGATFWFTLPLAREPIVASGSAPTA
ncbi:MAG: HAMP domain-containing histidine kinase [Planctomycetes bacterium]|nr:HAMP domain-containing histidine kinase [Planctomycetota bacterium]